MFSPSTVDAMVALACVDRSVTVAEKDALCALLRGEAPKPKAKAELCQAVFVTDVDCAACVKKVTENISFEKGVKDLEVKLEGGTVRVVYDSKKTDAATLEKAIQKLGYKTELKEDKKL